MSPLGVDGIISCPILAGTSCWEEPSSGGSPLVGHGQARVFTYGGAQAC